MRLKTTIKSLIVLLLVGLFSCETEQNAPVKQDLETFDGSLRYSTSVAKLRAPENADHGLCDVLRIFELREPWDLEMAWGTVTIYNDEEKIYIQIDAVGDFGIDAIWHFVGTEWPFTEDPMGNWHTYPGIVITYPDGLPGSYTLEIDREEWMDRGCFVLALKVRLWIPGLDPPESGMKIPRVYINFEDHLEYIWNEPFCLCYPGTGTPGYWKNHEDAWPVDEIEIGGHTYTKDEAITIMKRNGVKGNKVYNMFEQLVAAKLNVEIGNVSFCIDDTIADADDWMALYWPNGPDGAGAVEVSADSPAWGVGEPWHTTLDEYNNGLLCAEHRD